MLVFVVIGSWEIVVAELDPVDADLDFFVEDLLVLLTGFHQVGTGHAVWPLFDYEVVQLDLGVILGELPPVVANKTLRSAAV
jgi:hypothetical protein